MSIYQTALDLMGFSELKVVNGYKIPGADTDGFA